MVLSLVLVDLVVLAVEDLKRQVLLMLVELEMLVDILQQKELMVEMHQILHMRLAVVVEEEQELLEVMVIHHPMLVVLVMDMLVLEVMDLPHLLLVHQ